MQQNFCMLIGLHFHQNFNQDISSLAGSFDKLNSLHLGYCFNQDISSLAGSFPNLVSLNLGSDFNQDTSNIKKIILLSKINKIMHYDYEMKNMYNDYIKKLKTYYKYN
jgi:hypothetical protein